MIDIMTLVRENIKLLKPYSSARDEFSGSNKAMVFLDANENPFNNDLNRYPDPKQTEVKEMLSGLKGVASDQIFLGNGSDEIIDLIFRAFCEPKEDSVVILPPTYGMYKVCADINAVEIKEINLSKNFQPNVKKIFEVMDKSTKLLFLCSPNNPSGNSFSTELIEELLQNFKGIVVIDEAYIDFSEEDSWLNRIEEFPNLIVTQTFSKAFGMAGIRLGICYASKQIIAILNSIKPPYNVNELTQKKALECLEDYEIVQLQVEELKRNRNSLIEEFENIAIIKKIYPSDANFVLVKVDNADLRYKELLDKNIVIRNRSNQPFCENCLRLTVGTASENIKLVEALKSFKK